MGVYSVNSGKNCHFTGSSAELYVAYKLTSMGFPCYHPLMTQSKADLVFDMGGKLYKVQVKSGTKCSTLGSSGNKNRFIQIRLGGVGKPEYGDGDCDYVAMVSDGDVWMLPWDFCKDKSSISFSDSRLKKIEKYKIDLLVAE